MITREEARNRLRNGKGIFDRLFTEDENNDFKGFAIDSNFCWQLADSFGYTESFEFEGIAGHVYNREYLFSYSWCEGDMYLNFFSSLEELIDEENKTILWYVENDHERLSYNTHGKRKISEKENEIVHARTNGLEESIRCTLCCNPCRSNTGCDGSCCVDEDTLNKILQILTPYFNPTSNH